MRRVREEQALLPGEGQDGDHDTARHWVAVYSELARFLESVVAETADPALKSSIAERLARIRARIDFWQDEQAALTPSGAEAVLIADDHGRYVDANDIALEILGYGREELLRKSVWDLTVGISELDGLQLWQDFIHQGEQEGTYQLSSKDGAGLRFHYRARANVAPGRHESRLRLLGVTRT